MILPVNVEARLQELDGLIEKAQQDLLTWEEQYATCKADFEIAMARTRIALSKGPKTTVQEREDAALLACSDEYYALANAEAGVKGCRGYMNALRTQVDIARSLGASVRTSMDLA